MYRVANDPLVLHRPWRSSFYTESDCTLHLPKSAQLARGLARGTQIYRTPRLRRHQQNTHTHTGIHECSGANRFRHRAQQTLRTHAHGYARGGRHKTRLTHISQTSAACKDLRTQSPQAQKSDWKREWGGGRTLSGRPALPRPPTCSMAGSFIMQGVY